MVMVTKGKENDEMWREVPEKNHGTNIVVNGNLHGNFDILKLLVQTYIIIMIFKI